MTPPQVVANRPRTDHRCPSLPRRTAESVPNRLKTDAEIRGYPRAKGMVDTVLKERLISWDTFTERPTGGNAWKPGGRAL